MKIKTDQEFQAEVLRAIGEFALAVSRRGGFHSGGQPQPSELRNACELILAASPEKRAWLRAVFKFHGRARQDSFAPDELKLAHSTLQKALTQGADPGASLISEGIATDVYNLMLKYGAWRTLGVIPIDAFSFKAGTVTGAADAYWVSKINQGTAITADASITGTNISGEVLTLATLVEISNEALADGRTTFEGAVLEAIVMGLNYRLDWTCFQADGTDDTTDGAMTGIFANAAVPVSTPAAGKVTVASLDVADFAAVIGKVSAAALQWPCSWWISPSLLPALLYLRDGPEFILKRPTVAGGAWLLQGFPVEWTTGAPGADGPGKQLALFGRGAAYSVVLRQEFEIARGGAKFDQILTQLRATMRARCEMRDATAFAILKLPAA